VAVYTGLTVYILNFKLMAISSNLEEFCSVCMYA
jgi:hypothetical protein